MAARIGGTLLTRGGATALGEAVATKFVPVLGAAATIYGVYSAVTDGIRYFNDNQAACHDAKSLGTNVRNTNQKRNPIIIGSVLGLAGAASVYRWPNHAQILQIWLYSIIVIGTLLWAA